MQLFSSVKKFYSISTVRAITLTLVILIVLAVTIGIFFFDYLELHDGILDYTFYENVRKSYFVE